MCACARSPSALSRSCLTTATSTCTCRKARPRRTADGKQRPLGIAAIEDKIVEAAVWRSSIYEAEFLGFRSSSPHDAVRLRAKDRLLKFWPQLQSRFTQLEREGSPPPGVRLAQAKLSRKSN